jgi:site-specific DNA-cytosine methylase
MKINQIVKKLKLEILNNHKDINLIDMAIPLYCNGQLKIEKLLEQKTENKYFLSDKTIEKIFNEKNWETKVINHKLGRANSYCIDANYFKGTNTVLKSRRQLVYQDNKLRKLTPTECERLMGWSDNWTKFGLTSTNLKYQISDTQRYKMCGNSIVSIVPKVILDKIITDNNIKVFSTFSGVDGSCQLLDKKYQIVGFSEIDKYCIDVLNCHYPNVKNYGDITKIDTASLIDFDLMFASAPCQSYSHAGKRLGLDDVRGTLFYDVARILKDKQPKYFIFENVKGLLTHDKGNTFLTMLKVFSSVNYNIDFELCNSTNYGIPQNRERVFVVGKLKN